MIAVMWMLPTCGYEAPAWYPDCNHNGLGAATGAVRSCLRPPGYVANADDTVGGLVGTVRVHDGGGLGAQVIVGGETVATSPVGDFVFEALPAGEAALTAEVAGGLWTSAHTTVRIVADGTSNTTLEVLPLEVHPYTPEADAVIPLDTGDVAVTVPAGATIDAEGAPVEGGAVLGALSLAAEERVVAPDGLRVGDRVLDASRVIELRLLDAEGGPAGLATGATISVDWGVEGTVWRYGEEGWVEAGTEDTPLDTPGWWAVAEAVQADRCFAGRLVADGVPVAGASVAAIGAAGVGEGSTVIAITDEDGAFSVATPADAVTLDAGPWRLLDATPFPTAAPCAEPVLVEVEPASLYGEAALTGEGAGRAVGRADVDGDGVDELVVGAEGSVFLLDALALSQPLDARVNASRRLVDLATPFTADGGFGAAVAGVGDLDGDGGDEVAVGNARGAAWILWSGRGPEALPIDTPEVRLGRAFTGAPDLVDGAPGIAAAGLLRVRVLDLGGDGSEASFGCEDALVGGLTTLPGGRLVIGCPGIDRVAVRVSPFDADLLQLVPSDESAQSFGNAVAAADVDGDGTEDLVIGAPDREDGAGRAWIFLGEGEGFAAEPYARIDGPAGARAGAGVAAGEDLDGDGVGDVAVGGEEAGVWVVSGPFGGRVALEDEAVHLAAGDGARAVVLGDLTGGATSGTVAIGDPAAEAVWLSFGLTGAAGYTPDGTLLP